MPGMLFVFIVIIFFGGLMVTLVYGPKWQREHETLKTYDELKKKTMVWWSMPKEEWKASLKNAEIRQLFCEALATHEKIAQTYPKRVTAEMKSYHNTLEIGKAWCEGVEEMENTREAIPKASLAEQQVVRLRCDVMLGDAIRKMGEYIAKEPARIHFVWYREVLMNYYYALVMGEAPPNEKDVH